jgi:hypothetical protein
VNHTSVEEILTEHLRPLAAPPELRFSRSVARPHPPVWNAMLLRFAAATLVVLGGVEAVLHLRATSGIEYACTSSAQLQAWMRSSAGVDVPLPSALPPSVKLLGANRLAEGVEVVYTVEGRTEKLRVSNVRSAGPAHHFEDRPGGVVAWSMGGHLYQVESGDASLACRLCHSGA